MEDTVGDTVTASLRDEREGAGNAKGREGGVIALACDHGGYLLMQEVKAHLRARGLLYLDFGCDSTEAVDYPDYARKLCEAIQRGECSRGILACGTGIGISIAANKMRGIRAALCGDCFSAEATRLHNDANVLALGGRVVAGGLALKIVDTFLDTPFSGEERHARRIAGIAALEEREEKEKGDSRQEKAGEWRGAC